MDSLGSLLNRLRSSLLPLAQISSLWPLFYYTCIAKLYPGLLKNMLRNAMLRKYSICMQSLWRNDVGWGTAGGGEHHQLQLIRERGQQSDCFLQ
jgi:hypothetical protein